MGLGHNEFGELGDGTFNDSLMPVRIMENVASVYVSSRSSTNFLITTSGALYGWGCNSRGSIGNGTNYDSSFPVKILDDVAVVFNEDFAAVYAITNDGVLYAWGGYIGERENFGRVLLSLTKLWIQSGL